MLVRARFDQYLHIIDLTQLHPLISVSQAHLLSVFDNTRTVTFDEKVYDKILSLNSQEGETVSLENPVNAQVR